jgi:hypothetical protein
MAMTMRMIVGVVVRVIMIAHGSTRCCDLPRRKVQTGGRIWH